MDVRPCAPRKPYDPGAGDRIAAVSNAHPGADALDADAETPRLFVPDVDPEGDAYCFRNEFFAGALAQTSLRGVDAKAFLRNAINFANDRLRGTLGATILIQSATDRELGDEFEDLLAELRYGTIGVNAVTRTRPLTVTRATFGPEVPKSIAIVVASGVNRRSLLRPRALSGNDRDVAGPDFDLDFEHVL